MAKKIYEVAIDFESVNIEVEADSEDEANEKAMETVRGYNEVPEFWVGECREIKNG
jgi:hypothetical protein